MLAKLVAYFNKENVRFIITHLRGPVRDKMAKSGLTDKIGSQNFFLTIKDALYGFDPNNGASKISSKYAAQKNKKKK